MTAPDTSVLVAGADPEHPFFDTAAEALAAVHKRGRLIAHTLAETYAILSSAAYGHSPVRIGEYLDQFLGRAPVGLSPDRYPAAIDLLAGADIVGGAVYDGLIALGAKHGGAVLVSLDRRASSTYRRCAVEFELLLPG